MQYRKFGKLDWKVSALGFGAMRLPTTSPDPASVDVAESIRMIRYAIDHGVNYVDTAYPYHAGQSERTVGQALKDGYREKIRLATKLPARMVESAQDFDHFFNEQLERLQTKKIDFYLLHGLNKELWPKVRDLGVLRWAEKQMASGRIGYLGYSFHDEYPVFKGIVDGYDNWTFCQIQYNYVDVNSQAGRRGVEYAAGKGMAIVVMEPIRGGRLSRKPPDEVASLWSTVPKKRSQAEWALLWVWDQPEISLALSGMTKMEQVVENVAIADRSGVGVLTAEELAIINKVREAYKSAYPIPCTACGYCQPCPNGVAIPRILEMYNEAIVYGELRMGRNRYAGQGPGGLKPEERADNCEVCRECEEACPQKIPVSDWLKKAHDLLKPEESSK